MNVSNFKSAVPLAQAAPVAVGQVHCLMNRPSEGVHVPVDRLYCDVETGIRGDRWRDTAWLRLPDGRPDPRVQVSLTNLNVIRCFTGEAPDSHYLCGDNLYVDFNLTEANVPVGARIQIGEVVLGLSDVENDACGKFVQRFGADAFQLVRDLGNRPLRLRGVFCSILRSGWIDLGAKVTLVEY